MEKCEYVASDFKISCVHAELCGAEMSSPLLTVLPSAGHPLLVQGQSIAPIPGNAVLPVQPAAEEKEVETEMGPAVTIMKPILRFLQLLCENHNQDLQVWFH